MVQADTGRIRELSRYLLTKSEFEDSDLWLNIIANPHMLPDGVTVGEAVLISFIIHDFENVDLFTKKDCALWFTIFPLLKVVFPAFAIDCLEKLLKMEEKFQNKEKVLK